MKQQPGKVTVTDTATYPFWAFNWTDMEIFPHDEHGRQTGPSEKVKDIQEAFDLCEARNYPERTNERATELTDTKTTAGHYPHRVFASCPLRLSMEHLSCDGCRFYRKGRCTDWVVSALLGGVALADSEPRKCYEPVNEENEVDGAETSRE